MRRSVLGIFLCRWLLRASLLLRLKRGNSAVYSKTRSRSRHSAGSAAWLAPWKVRVFPAGFVSTLAGPEPRTRRTQQSPHGGHAPSPSPRPHRLSTSQTLGYSSPTCFPRSAADCFWRPEPRPRASEPWRHCSALAPNSRLCHLHGTAENPQPLARIPISRDPPPSARGLLPSTQFPISPDPSQPRPCSPQSGPCFSQPSSPSARLSLNLGPAPLSPALPQPNSSSARSPSDRALLPSALLTLRPLPLSPDPAPLGPDPGSPQPSSVTTAFGTSFSIKAQQGGPMKGRGFTGRQKCHGQPALSLLWHLQEDQAAAACVQGSKSTPRLLSGWLFSP